MLPLGRTVASSASALDPETQVTEGGLGAPLCLLSFPVSHSGSNSFGNSKFLSMERAKTPRILFQRTRVQF